MANPEDLISVSSVAATKKLLELAETCWISYKIYFSYSTGLTLQLTLATAFRPLVVYWVTPFLNAFRCNTVFALVSQFSRLLHTHTDIFCEKSIVLLLTNCPNYLSTCLSSLSTLFRGWLVSGGTASVTTLRGQPYRSQKSMKIPFLGSIWGHNLRRNWQYLYATKPLRHSFLSLQPSIAPKSIFEPQSQNLIPFAVSHLLLVSRELKNCQSMLDNVRGHITMCFNI